MSTARMKEKEHEAVSLAYLRQRGFKQAEDISRIESKVQSLEQMAFNVDSNPTLTNYISLYNPLESVPSGYDESYGALRNWVYASLDLYRPELLSILYPVFVHCYLDLVQRNFINEARAFIEKYRKDHEEKNAGDLTRLSSILSSHHVEENDLAKVFRRNKYSVKISSYSFELLITFLQQSNYMLIISIINQYIDLKTFSGHPTSLVEEEYRAITGRTEQEIQQLNQRPALFGLLSDEQPTAAAAAPAAAETKQPPSKRAKKEDETQEEAKVKIVQKVPEHASLEDLRKRVPLSSTALPSICFFTFLNTSHSLNSVEIASDSSMVAGCFSNSVIKLWDLKKKDTEIVTEVMQPKTEKKKSTNEYTTLTGHSGSVYSCAFSPDNKYLFSTAEDNTARLWSLETKSNVVCYKGHNYPVWSIDCSTLGYYFATASHDRTARLWSTDHIYPLRIFAGHLSDVDCVKFHPNCNYIATGSADKSIRLWEVNTGECARILTGHFGPVNALAFSPDGKMLASGSEDRNVILWDLGSGKRIRTFVGHKKRVWSLDFSNEGSLLASGSADNTICIWDVSKVRSNQAHASENGDLVPNPALFKPPGCSPELLAMYPTKKTPVFTVKFTRRNLLLGSGPFTDTS